MLTKKDVFDTVVGTFMTFGLLAIGYYAGRKKARWEEQGFDDRMDVLESRVYDVESWISHEKATKFVGEEALE